MSMEFPFGQTVFRDRRALIPDPYNPSKQVPGGDWGSSIQLAGAFVASSSSSSQRDATRAQILTSKSLYLGDTTADVVAGDRIRVGGTIGDLASGTAYLVEARPEADVNPFTGWQPVVEIPLTLTEG